jgi:hypothetical protein
MGGRNRFWKALSTSGHSNSVTIGSEAYVVSPYGIPKNRSTVSFRKVAPVKTALSSFTVGVSERTYLLMASASTNETRARGTNSECVDCGSSMVFYGPLEFFAECSRMINICTYLYLTCIEHSLHPPCRCVSLACPC